MGKKVLIVEDEPMILRILVRRVLAAGHEVSSTDDENEAIALEAGQLFDVVITDWDLTCNGQGWGDSLIRRIKDLGLQPRIALMSTDRRKAESAAVELGVRFIEKEEGFVQKVLDFIAE